MDWVRRIHIWKLEAKETLSTLQLMKRHCRNLRKRLWYPCAECPDVFNMFPALQGLSRLLANTRVQLWKLTLDYVDSFLVYPAYTIRHLRANDKWYHDKLNADDIVQQSGEPNLMWSSQAWFRLLNLHFAQFCLCRGHCSVGMGFEKGGWKYTGQ